MVMGAPCCVLTPSKFPISYFPISNKIKAAPVDVLVLVVVCVVGLFVRAVPIADGNGANGGI